MSPPEIVADMNDRILHRYTARKPDEPDSNSVVVELDTPEDCGAFGYLRGIRDTAKMLQLRKKTGEILAVGYGYLERVEFSPNHGITLHLPGKQIRILGRNLNAEVRPTIRLFEAITRHRVTWIEESPDSADLFGRGTDVVIESIEW